MTTLDLFVSYSIEDRDTHVSCATMCGALDRGNMPVRRLICVLMA